MFQNNFSFNSPEKTNNTSLISDDRFITLINNLSDLVKEYYSISKNTIDEAFNIFIEYEEDDLNIIPQLYSNIEEQKKI